MNEMMLREIFESFSPKVTFSVRASKVKQLMIGFRLNDFDQTVPLRIINVSDEASRFITCVCCTYSNCGRKFEKDIVVEFQY